METQNKENFILKSMEDTERLAEVLVSSVESLENDTDEAVLILLSGTLGTGKTTLSQTIAKNLGVTDTVISPTFILMKRYHTKNAVIKNLIHIDAYRLEKKEDLEKIGWEEIISENNSLILLEWPEKVEGIKLPKHTITVSLSHEAEEIRSAKIIIN